jgi:hypothetical protein
MTIDDLRKHISNAGLQAHVTELSDPDAFLVYFEQGSFHPDTSPEALRHIEGIVAIEQKMPENPHIYRVTVA